MLGGQGVLLVALFITLFWVGMIGGGLISVGLIAWGIFVLRRKKIIPGIVFIGMGIALMATLVWAAQKIIKGPPEKTYFFKIDLGKPSDVTWIPYGTDISKMDSRGGTSASFSGKVSLSLSTPDRIVIRDVADEFFVDFEKGSLVRAGYYLKEKFSNEEAMAFLESEVQKWGHGEASLEFIQKKQGLEEWIKASAEKGELYETMLFKRAGYTVTLFFYKPSLRFYFWDKTKRLVRREIVLLNKDDKPPT